MPPISIQGKIYDIPADATREDVREFERRLYESEPWSAQKEGWKGAHTVFPSPLTAAKEVGVGILGLGATLGRAKELTPAGWIERKILGEDITTATRRGLESAGQAITESIPEAQRDSVVGGWVRGVAGFAPMLAYAPAMPVLIGLQTFGEMYDRLIAEGMSPKEAYARAAGAGLLSGVTWGVGPTAIRAGAGAVVKALPPEVKAFAAKALTTKIGPELANDAMRRIFGGAVKEAALIGPTAGVATTGTELVAGTPLPAAAEAGWEATKETAGIGGVFGGARGYKGYRAEMKRPGALETTPGLSQAQITERDLLTRLNASWERQAAAQSAPVAPPAQVPAGALDAARFNAALENQMIEQWGKPKEINWFRQRMGLDPLPEEQLSAEEIKQRVQSMWGEIPTAPEPPPVMIPRSAKRVSKVDAEGQELGAEWVVEEGEPAAPVPPEAPLAAAAQTAPPPAPPPVAPAPAKSGIDMLRKEVADLLNNRLPIPVPMVQALTGVQSGRPMVDILKEGGWTESRNLFIPPPLEPAAPLEAAVASLKKKPSGRVRVEVPPKEPVAPLAAAAGAGGPPPVVVTGAPEPLGAPPVSPIERAGRSVADRLIAGVSAGLKGKRRPEPPPVERKELSKEENAIINSAWRPYGPQGEKGEPAAQPQGSLAYWMVENVNAATNPGERTRRANNAAAVGKAWALAGNPPLDKTAATDITPQQILAYQMAAKRLYSKPSFYSHRQLLDAALGYSDNLAMVKAMKLPKWNMEGFIEPEKLPRWYDVPLDAVIQKIQEWRAKRDSLKVNNQLRKREDVADVIEGQVVLGTRIEELMKIKWGDVFLGKPEKQKPTISRLIPEGGVVIQEAAKGGKQKGAIRGVPMLPEVRRFFTDLAARMRARIAAGDPEAKAHNPDNPEAKVFIIPGPKGINQHFIELWKEVGLPEGYAIRLHDMRSFFEMRQLEAGRKPEIFTAWVGHDVATFRKSYEDYQAGKLAREEAAKAARIEPSPPKGPPGQGGPGAEVPAKAAAQGLEVGSTVNVELKPGGKLHLGKINQFIDENTVRVNLGSAPRADYRVLPLNQVFPLKGSVGLRRFHEYLKGFTGDVKKTILKLSNDFDELLVNTGFLDEGSWSNYKGDVPVTVKVEAGERLKAARQAAMRVLDDVHEVDGQDPVARAEYLPRLKALFDDQEAAKQPKPAEQEGLLPPKQEPFNLTQERGAAKPPEPPSPEQKPPEPDLPFSVATPGQPAGAPVDVAELNAGLRTDQTPADMAARIRAHPIAQANPELANGMAAAIESPVFRDMRKLLNVYPQFDVGVPAGAVGVFNHLGRFFGVLQSAGPGTPIHELLHPVFRLLKAPDAEFIRRLRTTQIDARRSELLRRASTVPDGAEQTALLMQYNLLGMLRGEGISGQRWVADIMQLDDLKALRAEETDPARQEQYDAIIARREKLPDHDTGLDQSDYHLANDSEFFVNMLSAKSRAAQQSPQVRTWVGIIREMLRKLYYAIKDRMPLKPDADRLFRQIMSGNYDYNKAEAARWNFNATDDFSLSETDYQKITREAAENSRLRAAMPMEPFTRKAPELREWEKADRLLQASAYERKEHKDAKEKLQLYFDFARQALDSLGMKDVLEDFQSWRADDFAEIFKGGDALDGRAEKVLDHMRGWMKRAGMYPMPSFKTVQIMRDALILEEKADKYSRLLRSAREWEHTANMLERGVWEVAPGTLEEVSPGVSGYKPVRTKLEFGEAAKEARAAAEKAAEKLEKYAEDNPDAVDRGLEILAAKEARPQLRAQRQALNLPIVKKTFEDSLKALSDVWGTFKDAMGGARFNEGERLAIANEFTRRFEEVNKAHRDLTIENVGQFASIAERIRNAEATISRGKIRGGLAAVMLADAKAVMEKGKLEGRTGTLGDTRLAEEMIESAEAVKIFAEKLAATHGLPVANELLRRIADGEPVKLWAESPVARETEAMIRRAIQTIPEMEEAVRMLVDLSNKGVASIPVVQLNALAKLKADPANEELLNQTYAELLRKYNNRLNAADAIVRSETRTILEATIERNAREMAARMFDKILTDNGLRELLNVAQEMTGQKATLVKQAAAGLLPGQTEITLEKFGIAGQEFEGKPVPIVETPVQIKVDAVGSGLHHNVEIAKRWFTTAHDWIELWESISPEQRADLGMDAKTYKGLNAAIAEWEPQLLDRANLDSSILLKNGYVRMIMQGTGVLRQMLRSLQMLQSTTRGPAGRIALSKAVKLGNSMLTANNIHHKWTTPFREARSAVLRDHPELNNDMEAWERQIGVEMGSDGRMPHWKFKPGMYLPATGQRITKADIEFFKLQVQIYDEVRNRITETGSKGIRMEGLEGPTGELSRRRAIPLGAVSVPMGRYSHRMQEFDGLMDKARLQSDAMNNPAARLDLTQSSTDPVVRLWNENMRYVIRHILDAGREGFQIPQDQRMVKAEQSLAAELRARNNGSEYKSLADIVAALVRHFPPESRDIVGDVSAFVREHLVGTGGVARNRPLGELEEYARLAESRAGGHYEQVEFGPAEGMTIEELEGQPPATSAGVRPTARLKSEFTTAFRPPDYPTATAEYGFHTDGQFTQMLKRAVNEEMVGLDVSLEHALLAMQAQRKAVLEELSALSDAASEKRSQFVRNIKEFERMEFIIQKLLTDFRRLARPDDPNILRGKGNIIPGLVTSSMLSPVTVVGGNALLGMTMASMRIGALHGAGYAASLLHGLRLTGGMARDIAVHLLTNPNFKVTANARRFLQAHKDDLIVPGAKWLADKIVEGYWQRLADVQRLGFSQRDPFVRTVAQNFRKAREFSTTESRLTRRGPLSSLARYLRATAQTGELTFRQVGIEFTDMALNAMTMNFLEHTRSVLKDAAIAYGRQVEARLRNAGVTELPRDYDPTNPAMKLEADVFSRRTSRPMRERQLVEWTAQMHRADMSLERVLYDYYRKLKEYDGSTGELPPEPFTPEQADAFKAAFIRETNAGDILNRPTAVYSDRLRRALMTFMNYSSDFLVKLAEIPVKANSGRTYDSFASAFPAMVHIMAAGALYGLMAQMFREEWKQKMQKRVSMNITAADKEFWTNYKNAASTLGMAMVSSFPLIGDAALYTMDTYINNKGYEPTGRVVLFGLLDAILNTTKGLYNLRSDPSSWTLPLRDFGLQYTGWSKEVAALVSPGQRAKGAYMAPVGALRKQYQQLGFLPDRPGAGAKRGITYTPTYGMRERLMVGMMRGQPDNLISAFNQLRDFYRERGAKQPELSAMRDFNMLNPAVRAMGNAKPTASEYALALSGMTQTQREWFFNALQQWRWAAGVLGSQFQEIAQERGFAAPSQAAAEFKPLRLGRGRTRSYRLMSNAGSRSQPRSRLGTSMLAMR